MAVFVYITRVFCVCYRYLLKITESIKEEEDTLKKIPSIFKKHHHDFFEHPGLKNFFHKHFPIHKPKPHPKPEPKPCPPKPCPDDKPEPCPNHAHKPKHVSVPTSKPKPVSVPVTKPHPHPIPVFKKPPFHVHPFFKKPFFSHPKKPVSPWLESLCFLYEIVLPHLRHFIGVEVWTCIEWRGKTRLLFCEVRGWCECV